MRAQAVTAPLLVAVTTLSLTACTQSAERDADASNTAISSTPSSAESKSPVGNTLTVTKSLFEVAYRLDGAIFSGSVVAIDVPTGTELRPAQNSGAVVKKGQPLGSLQFKSAATDGAEGGTVAQSQRQLVSTRLRPLVAPTSGLVRLSPTSARVEHPGLDVVVPLKPLQELRYRGMNFAGKATVETVLGQRESPCVAVWIEPAPAGTEPAQGDAAGDSAVHCRLPADLETAAGLPAVLTLTSQRLADVVAVPLIYVGLDKAGENYVARVRQGGSFVERPVVVGSTDGVRRVVTSGLAPGDVIAPVAQP